MGTEAAAAVAEGSTVHRRVEESVTEEGEGAVTVIVRLEEGEDSLSLPPSLEQWPTMGDRGGAGQDERRREEEREREVWWEERRKAVSACEMDMGGFLAARKARAEWLGWERGE